MGGEDGCRILPNPSHMLVPQGMFTSQEPGAGLEQLLSQASQVTQNTTANSWKVPLQRPVEQLNRINPVYTLPANLPSSPSPSQSSRTAAKHPQTCTLTPEEQSRKGSTKLRKLRGYDEDNLWPTPAPSGIWQGGSWGWGKVGRGRAEKVLTRSAKIPVVTNPEQLTPSQPAPLSHRISRNILRRLQSSAMLPEESG